MLEAGGQKAEDSEDIPAVREEQSINLNRPSLNLVLVGLWESRANSGDIILELRKPRFRVVSDMPGLPVGERRSSVWA